MIRSFGDKETKKNINNQWRIIFKFVSGNCFEVSIVDSH